MDRDKVAFEDLRDQYLLCRTISHSWDEVPTPDLPKPESGYWWFNLRCTRCTAARIDLVDHAGHVASRRYEHPPFYQLDEKVTRQELRVEWARRNNLGINKSKSNNNSNKRAKQTTRRSK